MIDSFAILTTTIAVLYVMLRAAALDRSLPWFETDDAAKTDDGRRPLNAADSQRR